MALFDIFSKNKQIKKEDKDSWLAWNWFSSPNIGKYSDVYFYTLIKKVFNGLSNVRYINLTSNFQLDTLTDFLTNHIQDIVWLTWKDGYVVINETSGEYSLITQSPSQPVRTDTYGKVIIPSGKHWIVFYTYPYRLQRKSDFQIIREQLHFIDRLAGSMDFLTSTYGSVGIITGKTMPLNTQDKQELSEQLKQSLGITRDKQQFIIARGNDFDIKQFSFDLSSLDLSGKLKDQYLLLADYFNIPKNILTTDTDSTYENQEAALKRFYTDCITPLAEMVLSIGQSVLLEMTELFPSDSITFTIDNVEVINQDKNTIEALVSLTDLVAKTDDPGIRVRLLDRIRKKIDDWK